MAASPGLNKKIGPLPAKAWLVGLAVAVAVGLYFRHRSAAAASSTTTAAPAAADTGSSGGASSSGTGTGVDSSSVDALTQSIYDLQSLLAAGDGGWGTSTTSSSTPASDLFVTAGGQTYDTGYTYSQVQTLGGYGSYNSPPAWFGGTLAEWQGILDHYGGQLPASLLGGPLVALETAAYGSNYLPPASSSSGTATSAGGSSTPTAPGQLVPVTNPTPGVTGTLYVDPVTGIPGPHQPNQRITDPTAYGLAPAGQTIPPASVNPKPGPGVPQPVAPTAGSKSNVAV